MLWCLCLPYAASFRLRGSVPMGCHDEQCGYTETGERTLGATEHTPALSWQSCRCGCTACPFLSERCRCLHARLSRPGPSLDAGRGAPGASHASAGAASWSKAWLARCDALAAGAVGCASPPGAARLLGGKPPASLLPVLAAGRSALRSNPCSAHAPGSVRITSFWECCSSKQLYFALSDF